MSPKHQPGKAPTDGTLSALADARAGRYDVLVVWALDRLTREDPLETLEGQAAAEAVGLRHTRGASR